MIERYLKRFPEETVRLRLFREFVGRTHGAALYDRKNPDGHVTASAMIYDAHSDAFLLLHHRRLDRYLQPGGHVEPNDSSVMAAARREVAEETGLSPNDYEWMSDRSGLRIFDLDTHAIPACPEKGEGEHYHHDVRFFLRLQHAARRVQLDSRETIGFRWVPAHSLAQFFDSIRPVEKRLSYDVTVDKSFFI